jgi:hypothetical protein
MTCLLRTAGIGTIFDELPSSTQPAVTAVIRSSRKQTLGFEPFRRTHTQVGGLAAAAYRSEKPRMNVESDPCQRGAGSAGKSTRRAWRELVLRQAPGTAEMGS